MKCNPSRNMGRDIRSGCLFLTLSEQKRVGLLLSAVLFMVSVCISSLSADETYGPGFHLVDPVPVHPSLIEWIQPEESEPSELYFGGGDDDIDPIGCEVTPEIEELARSLDNDPWKIYEYVHNQIEYQIYEGSLKGATMTLLDQAGNDIDQVSLMIALLRAAGNDTGRYVYGYLFPGYGAAADGYERLANWIGVEADLFIIYVALAKGSVWSGIHSSYKGLGMAVEHVCLQVKIDGETYRLDPSFKQYRRSEGIIDELKGELGDVRSTLLDATREGAFISADGREVRNLNEGDLQTQLASYTQTVLSYLREHYPGAGVEDIIGGAEIIPDTDYEEALYYHWERDMGKDLMKEVPSGSTHTLTVKHGTFNKTYNIPSIAHKRLSVYYNGGAGIWLEDTEQLPRDTSTKSRTLQLTEQIPEGSKLSRSYYLQRQNGYCYDICFGQGGSLSRERLERRNRIYQKYDTEGKSLNSREMLSEGLHLLGQTYAREEALIKTLWCRVADCGYMKHAMLGLSAQELGCYIDMNTMGALYEKNSDKEVGATFTTLMMMSSALEHGVMEQMQGSEYPGISTVKLLQRANAEGKRIFMADTNNWDLLEGEDVKSVCEAGGWTILSALEKDVKDGRVLILSEDGNPSEGVFSGYGYISYNNEDVMMTVDRCNGGYSTGADFPSAEQSTLYEMFEPINNYGKIGDASSPRYADPVDMRSGGFQYENTDLNLGRSGVRGLSLDRYYDSTRHALKGPLGYGWQHSYEEQVRENNDIDAGFGLRGAEDVMPMLVGAIATLEMMEDNPGLHEWMTGVLIAKWCMDQVIENAVDVKMGRQTLRYIRLPGGGYNRPEGVKSMLEEVSEVEGGGYKLIHQWGGFHQYDSEGRLVMVQDGDGLERTNTYSGANLSKVEDSCGRSLDFMYNLDGTLAWVIDEANRKATYTYNSAGDLITYTDPENYDWHFNYDSLHRMTNIVDPRGITNVVNLYDERGRVSRQLSADGHWWGFHYNDAFTMGEDPEGYRKRYDYNKDGLLTGITDEEGHQTRTEYNAAGKTIRTIDALGNATRYDYDKRGNVTNIVTALSTNRFEYDTLDRLTKEVDGAGNETAYTYDGNHQRIATITDAEENLIERIYYTEGSSKGLLKELRGPGLDQVVMYQYDDDGNLTREIYEDGSFKGMGYDVIGNVMAVTNEADEATAYTYDNRRMLKTVTYPDTISDERWYDGFGLKIRERDRRGNETQYAYSPSEKLTKVIYADGAEISYAYDKVGNLTNITDALSSETAYRYDGTGRRTMVIDGLGNIMRYAYDANGNLTNEMDALGEHVTTEYDELNRPVVVRDALGAPTWTYYDNAGNISSNVNALGVGISYTYDGLGRLKTTELPGELEETVDYNARGNVILQTDALGNETSCGYDLRGRLVVVTNSLGYAMTNQYDLAGHISVARDALGNATTMAYDELGRLKKITDADNGETTYEYDENGNRVLVIDARGYRTESDYDERNRLVKVRQQVADNEYVMTSHRYNANGELIETENGEHHVTRYYYDALGRLVKTVYADGGEDSIYYDAAGRKEQTMARDGAVMEYQYDAAGRVKTVSRLVTNGDPVVVHIDYDLLGNVSKETDAEEHDTCYYYDDLNRVTNIVYADTTEEIFEYDEVGNMIKQTDPTGIITTYGYDEMKQLVAVTNVLDGKLVVSRSTYDAAGNVIGMEDPLERPTVMYYDALNRLTNIVYADSSEEVIEYDAVGHHIGMEDGEDRRVEYAYDGLGRLTKTTIKRDAAIDLKSTQVYDADGNMLSRRDEAGKETQYAYDALGLLKQVMHSDGTAESYTYDPSGRMKQFINGRNHTTSFDYNELGQLSEDRDALQKARTFMYDRNGQIKTLTTRTGEKLAYDYDNRNRLDTIKQDEMPLASFEYDDAGRMTKLTDNLGETIWEYDDLGRLVRIEDPRDKELIYEYDLAGNRTNIIYPEKENKKVSYTYDLKNQLSTVTSWASTEPIRYWYDDSGILTNIVYPNGVETVMEVDERGAVTALRHIRIEADETETVLLSRTITRNDLGNIISAVVQGMLGISLSGTDRTHLCDAVDQIETVTDESPEPATVITLSYDDDGNLTGSEGALSSATWDAEGRLTGATLNGHVYAYTYNGLGNRLVWEKDGVENYSVLNYGAPLHNPLATYRGDSIRYDIYGMGLSALIDESGTVHYCHADEQGNIVLLTDADGNVTDQYEYDSFGNVIAKSGTTENPYLFGGLMGVTCEDEAVGLYHMKARYYSSQLKRFISRDPLGLEGGNNLYAYAENNPLSYVDPHGLCPGHIINKGSSSSDSYGWIDMMSGNALSSFDYTYTSVDQVSLFDQAKSISAIPEKTASVYTSSGYDVFENQTLYSSMDLTPDLSLSMPVSLGDVATASSDRDLYSVKGHLPEADKWLALQSQIPLESKQRAVKLLKEIGTAKDVLNPENYQYYPETKASVNELLAAYKVLYYAAEQSDVSISVHKDTLNYNTVNVGGKVIGTGYNYGMYDQDSNEIALYKYAGLGTLIHELGHRVQDSRNQLDERGYSQLDSSVDRMVSAIGLKAAPVVKQEGGTYMLDMTPVETEIESFLSQQLGLGKMSPFLFQKVLDDVDRDIKRKH